MMVHQGLCNRQAQADTINDAPITAHAAMIAAAFEGVLNAVQVLFGNANTSVSYDNVQTALRTFRQLQLDKSAPLGEFNGIGYQIDHHLLDGISIREQDCIPQGGICLN